MWLKAHGYFSLNMAASRGCPFRCAWCAKPIWGNQYLQRDAAEVAAEMAYLKRSFNPDHIWFADDIFGFRVDWVAEFAACRTGRRRRDSLHHPNPRGLGERTHGRCAARCRMPGGMDRRRERQPKSAGRDEQGHDGGGDPHCARPAQSGRHSSRFLHSVGLYGRRARATFWPRAICSTPRGRMRSASACRIPCRAPNSTSWSRRSSAARRIGRRATTWT